MQNEDFKGYTLFNDIEDVSLRNRNRAVIMSNIAKFNVRSGKINAKGQEILIGYFYSVPDTDKKDVMERFEERTKEIGYTTQ